MTDPTDSADRSIDLDDPWVIVGCGRLGRALAVAGRSRGVDLRATWNRTPDRAEATARLVEPDVAASGELPEALAECDFSRAVVWLTVVDDAVEPVARSLAGKLGGARVVLHSAGALESSLLRDAGIEPPVGTLHPLLAITDPESAAGSFGDVAWSIEGDEAAVEFGRRFTDAFGARRIELEEGSRALYHASASTAANLLVALADTAMDMAVESGLSRDDAREVLLPLMESSIDNLRSDPTSGALSGPAARGDESTIERHLEALETHPELRSIYERLTERARELADRDE